MAGRDYSGEVLIPGGFNANPLSTMGDFFFTVTPPRFGIVTRGMANARYMHTATLLSNGMVLIVGGDGTGDVPVGPAELY